MTSEQVLLDEAAAPDASADTTPKPKTVRRRTTKKTEVVADATHAPAEQPTLPELSNEVVAEAAPGETAPGETASALKPKRTRATTPKEKTVVPKTKTTTAKTKATKTKNELETSESQEPTLDLETAAPVEPPTAAPSTPVTVEAASTPEVSAPGRESSFVETPPVRPSVPARFPSRFKRTPPAAPEPEPVETASVAETQAPVVEPAPQLVSEAAIETREEMETRAPESAATGESSASNTSSEVSAVEGVAPQDGGPTSPQAGDGQSGPSGGEFNGQNGEYPEGFGRMRYRERREFRRQQRMQQRQERFGDAPPPQQGQQNGFQGQPGNFQGQQGNFQGQPNNFQGQPNNFQGQPNGFQGRQDGFNGRPNQGFVPQPRRREYDYFTLRAMPLEELQNAAQEYSVDMEVERDHEELVMAVMEAQARVQNSVLKTGILDAHDHNKAFLRCEGYIPSENDVYVSQTQIKRFNLKTGDLVFGTARAPKENERFFGLLRVESINGLSPEEMRSRKDFEKMTPIFPDSRYHLETEQGNITARIIDLFSPIGKGQRGLIVAPPKAGKTTLLKNIANSITKNNPEAELFVLLIDERPEEVTDISRSVRGEVVASTFDEMPENHMRVADIVLERAKRLVEMKRDVVILLDSITRLSRASNLVVTPSGRTLSGGLDPAAMYRPKRMFGAARNIEEGGSLTILATALVDTGSRMDEMIFEEFKGTGNMDLVLDRDLFNQRIFPAIDINKTGTRRDDLLMSKDELAATFHLRQTLARLDNDQAVKLMIDRLKNTKSNGDFMAVVAKSARQAEIKAAS